MQVAKKGGKKGRGIGRNKSSCEKYQAQNQREQNKGRRLVRYMRKHPGDLIAMKALRKISGKVAGFSHAIAELEAA